MCYAEYNFWIFVPLRPPSCLTSRSPTCPSCPASWRRRCLPLLSTARSYTTTTRTKSTRWECLTVVWKRCGCWTSGRRRCAPRCTRNAPTLKKQVRAGTRGNSDRSQPKSQPGPFAHFTRWSRQRSCKVVEMISCSNVKKQSTVRST